MKLKDIRYNARESMSGKWGKFIGLNLLLVLISTLAVVITLAPVVINIISEANSIVESALAGETYTVSSSVASFAITYILYIVVMLFAVPLNYAFLENMINLKRNENTKCTEFFGLIFKRFGRAWKVALWCIVKILILYLIFFAGIIVYSILVGVFGALGLTPAVVALVILLVIAMFVYFGFLIARVFSLILAQYIAIDNPEYLPKQCVDKSISLMKGYKWKYFCLNLSFIGWMILSMLTWGMGLVFLVPYMHVSYICFYEEVCKEKNETAIIDKAE